MTRRDLLNEYGVRLNVIGKTDLLPKNVLTVINKAQALTKTNSRYVLHDFSTQFSIFRSQTRSILNICMAYASTDEITTSAEICIRKALNTNDLQAPFKSTCLSFADGLTSSITDKDIEENLMSTLAGSPPLDVIVRTSGVNRLSDFFLWQSCERVQVHFCPTFWPSTLR